MEKFEKPQKPDSKSKNKNKNKSLESVDVVSKRSRSPHTPRSPVLGRTKSVSSLSSGKGKITQKQAFHKGKPYERSDFLREVNAGMHVTVGKEAEREEGKGERKRMLGSSDKKDQGEEGKGKDKEDKEEKKRRRNSEAGTSAGTVGAVQDEVLVEGSGEEKGTEGNTGSCMESEMDYEQNKGGDRDGSRSEISDREERVSCKLEEIRGMLMQCLLSERSTVSKRDCKSVLDCFARVENLLQDERRRTAELEGRLAECCKEKAHLRMSLAAGSVAASGPPEMPGAGNFPALPAVQRPVPRAAQGRGQLPGPAVGPGRGQERSRQRPLPRPPAKPSFALVVKQGAGVSNQEALRKVKECVNESVNVRVCGVREARSGGVVLELPTLEERAKVLESGMFNGAGLTVGEPRGNSPRLTIYDVPSELLGGGFLEALRARNFGDLTPEQIQSQVRVISNREVKGAGLSNLVVEVTQGMGERMLRMGRVYVGWMSCRVREWMNVVRCWNCMEYGHWWKECKNERLCRGCGKAGHLVADCREPARCVNCAKVRGARDLGHSAMSTGCPEFVWRMQRMRERMRPREDVSVSVNVGMDVGVNAGMVRQNG